ncbi:hypothetical protein, partial [Streptomyces sp. TR06-5]|uniref:hypothetical protein n=1 Tax=Streptomyces sp. TR06-5 TaxID=3385976 RepID=UPI0039A01321
MLSSALTLGLVPILEGVATAQALREGLTTQPGQAAGSESRPLSEEEAFAKAARTGELVEVVSMRGESTEVYATPGGTLEAREYLAPVWARVDG